MKSSFYKLIKVVFEASKILQENGETPILTSFSQKDFKSYFSFDPHFTDLKKPNKYPHLDLWLDLKDKVIKEFNCKGLYHLNPKVIFIFSDIASVINNKLKNKNLLDKFTPANSPDYAAKRELLERIIDCPDTEVLKMIDRKGDLDFLLFNHPSYTDNTNSYLHAVYFDNPGWNSLAFIDCLLSRVSSLKIDDFEKVGLEEEINSEALMKLKKHVKRVIEEFIQEFDIYNYQAVGVTYQSKELRDSQLEAIRALWKAASYHENSHFISYSKFSEVFECGKSFYTDHITLSGMISDLGVIHFSKKLDGFITEEASSISSLYITSNIDLSYTNEKLKNYVDAKAKLLHYSQLRQEHIEIWLKSDESTKSWFENLFIPSGHRPGYAYGFGDDALYRGFMVTMNLLGYFGTDFISGIAIPNTAFDNNNPQFKYATHHPSKNKMSLALYDQILTMKQYSLHDVYESMSEIQQSILKYGIWRLL